VIFWCKKAEITEQFTSSPASPPSHHNTYSAAPKYLDINPVKVLFYACSIKILATKLNTGKQK